MGLFDRLRGGWVYEDDADYVIVGTGAGGATAGKVLAEAGHDVLFLEEGPRLKTKDRPRDAIGALSGSMRQAATQTTAGPVPIPVLDMIREAEDERAAEDAENCRPSTRQTLVLENIVCGTGTLTVYAHPCAPSTTMGL